MESYFWFGVAVGLPLLVAIITVLATFFIVEEKEVAIVQRLGKFHRIANAGFHLRIPFIDQIAERLELRIQQLDMKIETKTKDNVFVILTVSVQYMVQAAKVYDAYYKLQDPEEQIKSFVFDVVRGQVPDIELDALFVQKDKLAIAVKTELAEAMDDFGYEIVKALVPDVEPEASVKAAMNNINAAQRNRAAATEVAEANRITMIAQAQAEAESKKLQGEGIANQRKALIDGLRESVEHFQSGIPGASAEDVMNLVMVTQFFDTLAAIGSHANTNTILIPHSPGFVGDLMGQLRGALLSTREPDGTVDPSKGATALSASHHDGANGHLSA